MIIIQGNVRHTNLNGQAAVEWSNEFRSFPRSSAKERRRTKKVRRKTSLVLYFEAR